MVRELSGVNMGGVRNKLFCFEHEYMDRSTKNCFSTMVRELNGVSMGVVCGRLFCLERNCAQRKQAHGFQMGGVCYFPKQYSQRI